MGSRRESMVGIRVASNDVAQSLADARTASFNFVCVGKILRDDFVLCEMNGAEFPKDEPNAWFDMNMPASDWSMNVVGILRNMSDYLEGPDFEMAERAEKIMIREIEYAQHLALPALMLELTTSEFTNLARIIHQQIATGTTNAVKGLKFWVKVPMTNEDQSETSVQEDPWNLWNRFRSFCNFETKLFPVLEFPLNLPSDKEVSRWSGEPVKAIFLSTRVFSTNSKGYPVLSKKQQLVLKRFMELGAQVIVNTEDLTENWVTSLSYYKQYIGYLHQTVMDELVDDYGIMQFANGYEDYLQSPLQPLQDNLESHTYEVFEKDPVKYELYQKAVYQALLDMVPEGEATTRTVVLMVVGAGRGPLVRSSLRAAEEAKRQIRVYAVEKNMNAYNTLLHLRKLEWGDQVTVVNCDMREWQAPEKADIMVSELLGSFGDNELSPECLDGAQKFLSANGVMIPQSYTSYISPIMSSKLYNEVRRYRDVFKNIYSQFETPYVVHMKSRYEIARAQRAFTFCHPKPDVNVKNNRQVVLHFNAKQDCVLHGFCGYFESTLYGDVLMSILPETFSKGMFSWFPIYFPLREPIQVLKGNKITANFWRRCNNNSVWYEWSSSSPSVVPVHNPSGRSYTIGL